MSKKLITVILIGLVGILIMASGGVADAESAIIYVPDNYLTIQAAVDAASPGDTIIVRDGTYREGITINKQLTLRGINGPVIDATANVGTKNGINVRTNGVNIEGFKIINARVGIHLSHSTNNTLKNNILEQNNYYGISLEYSDFNNIANNTVNLKQGWGRNPRYGIYLYHSHDNVLQENTANNTVNNTGQNNSNGIYLENSDNNTLHDNEANYNAAGIKMIFSNNNILEKNTADYNMFGINMYASSNNTLKGNLMSDNCVANFTIEGVERLESDLGLDHNIDATNLVDGKSIYYLKNQSDVVIDASSNAGLVYCINCENIIIKDSVIDGRSSKGIYFYKTNNSTIDNVEISGSYTAITLKDSHSNIIKESIVSKNFEGIDLNQAMDNDIVNNIIKYNNTKGDGLQCMGHSPLYGVRLHNSNNNRISGNLIMNNPEGITLSGSNSNTLFGNTIENNTKGISNGSLDNLFYHNNLIDNISNEYGSRANQWFNFEINQGNYYSFYDEPVEGCNDVNNDSICDNPYIINNLSEDKYPLVMPFENYFMQTQVGLVAEWKFNGGTGDIAYDSSENNNDGTIYGASWTDGISGTALFFNGVDDYVEILDDNSLNNMNEMSIEAWVYIPLDTVTNKVIIAKDAGTGNHSYGLRIDISNRLQFYVFSDTENSEWVGYTLPPILNKWFYIVGTYDGENVKLFVNGVEGGIRNGDISGKIQDSTAQVCIGRYSALDSGFFNGVIDEVRIWDRALSAEDIQAYYEEYVSEDQPPICVIKFQKDGEDISEVMIDEFFDIVFTDYNGNIDEVRFLSDELQNGQVDEGFTWTDPPYNWDTSFTDWTGSWDGSNKIKTWSFATGGEKEVWAEVRDSNNITSTCFADISAIEKAPSENQPPNPPTDLLQFKSDWEIQIDVGATTNERTVVFKGKVIDPDGDKAKLQIELRRLDEYERKFDDTKEGLKLSAFSVYSGENASVQVDELINADYHWRARAVDKYGEASGWVEFGGNDISDEDFVVSAPKILSVPYYSQGNTDWCVPTSMSIILKYYGKNIHSWDIAKDWGIERDETVWPAWDEDDDVEEYFMNHGLSTDIKEGDDINFDVIKNSINNDNPVFLSIRSLNPLALHHAVVIIGYEVKDGKKIVYVNDSSGALDEKNIGQGRLFIAREVELNDLFNHFGYGTYAIIVDGDSNPPKGTLNVDMSINQGFCFLNGENNILAYSWAYGDNKGIDWMPNLSDPLVLGNKDSFQYVGFVANHTESEQTYMLKTEFLADGYSPFNLYAFPLTVKDRWSAYIGMDSVPLWNLLGENYGEYTPVISLWNSDFTEKYDEITFPDIEYKKSEQPSPRPPSEFWVEINRDGACIYKDENGDLPSENELDKNKIKCFPNGWVLKRLMENNNFITKEINGVMWWKVIDVTDEVSGWMKESDLNLDSNKQKEWKGKTTRVMFLRDMPSNFEFKTDLSAGSSGDNVVYLQIILNANSNTQIEGSGVGSIYNETDYFGKKTKNAVIKFQEYYCEDILEGLNNCSCEEKTCEGTGFVGSRTREKLNSLIDSEDFKNILKDQYESERGRTTIIRETVEQYRTQYLPDDFPIGLILAVIIGESGGANYNNECIGTSIKNKDWGRGIMQVDTDEFVGNSSGIKCYGDDMLNKCRPINKQNNDCFVQGKKCYEDQKNKCKCYYTNTIQGIEANIKDGLSILSDKYDDSKCYYGSIQCGDYDDVSKNWKIKNELKDVKLNESFNDNITFNFTCGEFKKWNNYYNRYLYYNSIINSIDIKSDNEINKISCNEFKVIDALWRYNGRSYYGYGTCMGNDYLRCIANKLNETEYNFNEIIDFFGYSLLDKSWIKKLKIVSVSDDSSIFFKIKSPGDIQVFDSHGLITGLVDGKIREEIPFSSYDKDNKIIIISFSSDIHSYKVVGNDEGIYGLIITSIVNGKETTFNATDIPTTPNEVHQYTIDWQALSQGEEGVTIQIDKDGDGDFEETIITGETFQAPVADDEPNQTAYVVPSGGGGLSPALSISGTSIVASAIKENTATISWKTSLFSTSRIIYSSEDETHNFASASPPNYGYANSIEEILTKATGHHITLTDLSPGTTYYYRCISASSPEIISQEHSFTTLGVKKEEVIVLGIESNYREIQLQQILTDANDVWTGDVNSTIANAGVKRDLAKEAEGANKYTLPLIEGITGLTAENKNAITNFVVYGTNSTQILGAGERAGVINSYKSAFGKLPATESEWEDVIKIANGRWPSETNPAAEEKAKTEFKKVYKRDPDMNNPNDNAAVTVIAYGLRPSDRNLDSEKAGIKTFKHIYGYDPASAIDWDIVRAIAYSGATR